MPIPSLIIHGGAGPIPQHEHADYNAGSKAAFAAGWEILAAGGTALSAVEAAVRVMEDHPVFDAGVGSVLTRAGDIELDAMIMDGRDLNLGAVASVRSVANPITLARRVMEDTAHSILVGDGARQYAIEIGMPLCSQAELTVPREIERFQDYQRKIAQGSDVSLAGHDTVGAVAVDSAGNVATATSTGGMALKMPGRVGDSPLVGSGGYADNVSGAASATGQGEYIMRVLLSKTAIDLLLTGLSAQEAADRAIQIMTDRVGGKAGIIVVERSGEVGFAHTTAHMAVAWCPDGENIQTYI